MHDSNISRGNTTMKMTCLTTLSAFLVIFCSSCCVIHCSAAGRFPYVTIPRVSSGARQSHRIQPYGENSVTQGRETYDGSHNNGYRGPPYKQPRRSFGFQSSRRRPTHYLRLPEPHYPVHYAAHPRHQLTFDDDITTFRNSQAALIAALQAEKAAIEMLLASNPIADGITPIPTMTCEDDAPITITCGMTQISTIMVTYGYDPATDGTTCTNDPMTTDLTGCMVNDVTSTFSAGCVGSTSCVLDISDMTIGTDPCPIGNSIGRVTYTCSILTDSQIVFFEAQYALICSQLDAIETTSANVATVFDAIFSDLTSWSKYLVFKPKYSRYNGYGKR
ncbi:PREDICTED: uncharacterized protein LOC106820798 [Priapulus caudatus]|uniref:Uncharacterized protein LOC106820798 n=1 Tax=Priapulus caudatus TaxID=37621 RepID=A0ABM1F8T6_PRICU|nr:PREDICTED: uncharacterized protein LOC106820798 [Priapulus caudatus]